MRRQLIFIGIFVGLIAGLGFYVKGLSGMAAVVFGGGILLNNLFLQYRFMRRAESQARADAKHNWQLMMSCATQRFITTIALFALGMGALQLPPLAVIGGFGVALVAQYVGDPNFRTLRT